MNTIVCLVCFVLARCLSSRGMDISNFFVNSMVCYTVQFLSTAPTGKIQSKSGWCRKKRKGFRNHVAVAC